MEMTLTSIIYMLSWKRDDISDIGQDRTVKVIDKTDVDGLELQLRSLDEFIEITVMPTATYSIDIFKRHSTKGELAAHPIDFNLLSQGGPTYLVNTLDRRQRIRFWMICLLAIFGFGAIAYGILLFKALRAKRARVLVERAYIRAT